jgi:nucleotide-binding universal stress UspA family protein
MQQSTPDRTCLVAVDGTAAGVDALVWALRHAADHDSRVDVLTVWPDHRSVFVHEVPGHFCAARWDAVVAQEDTIRRAADVVSTAPIGSVSLENADVAEAIVRASATHDLVVLGSESPRGRHGLTDRIIDSAPCDVVVVRSHPREQRP